MYIWQEKWKKILCFTQFFYPRSQYTTHIFKVNQILLYLFLTHKTMAQILSQVILLIFFHDGKHDEFKGGN
jgi:hypothetical protein